MNRLINSGFLRYLLLYAIFFTGIYFYFYEYRTQTIYGDDLSVIKEQAECKGLSDIIAVGKPVSKFRPVSGVISAIEIHFFDKTESDYFRFNVAVQAFIALMFTAVTNLLLKSFLLSALMGIIIGLSRFAYYNITQIMCGGPLEGLAMFLFLAAIYNIVAYLIYFDNERTKSQYYYLAWALIYANLAMYTHERYMVLFPLIIFISFFHPLKNKLSGKQKMFISFLAIGSLFANFAIKKYVYHYHFFVGTGTSPIATDFNLKRQLGFLGDALASFVQFNSGEEYQIGVNYHHITDVHYALVMTTIACIALVLGWYMISNIKTGIVNNPSFKYSVKLNLILLIIFFVVLAPAVSTIAYMQRWLQGPLAVFLLIVCVAFRYTKAKMASKTMLLVLLMVVYQISDRMYIIQLNRNFWMKGSEWVTSCFKDLVSHDFLPKSTNTIYILTEKLNPNTIEGMNWNLWRGYFFEFYQGKSKQIRYLDSMKFTDPVQLKYMIDFDRKTEQVILYTNGLFMYTDDVMRERDKYFAEHGITAKK
ncbi:MAG: hypothetical protein K0Q79_1387 [Flavipsychrobacter sp.]|jgi:hypothetical protein|nr:hypothetical protein [Flavipsychrobacter sp.]